MPVSVSAIRDGFVGAMPFMIVGSFLLVAAPMKDGHLPASHLGGTGIFTAIIVAIFVTELTRFLKERNIGFTLPDQVQEKGNSQ